MMRRELCVVCGNELLFQKRMPGNVSASGVCESIACRRIVDQAATMDPSIAANFLEFQRQRIKLDSEARESAKRRMDERFAREAAEADAILKQTLVNHPELSPDDVCVVTIPSGMSRVSSLPASRIQTYRQHLEAVIRECREVLSSDQVQTEEPRNPTASETAFARSPALQIVSETMCGMCKGGCCTAGGDKAYITRSTIGRLLQETPSYSDTDLLDAYLSRLNAETLTNACINQSPSGCVLPRSLRSDTCNDYFCKSLLSWHESTTSKITDAVLIIQRANSDWGHSGSQDRNPVVGVAMISTRDSSVLQTASVT